MSHICLNLPPLRILFEWMNCTRRRSGGVLWLLHLIFSFWSYECWARWKMIMMHSRRWKRVHMALEWISLQLFIVFVINSISFSCMQSHQHLGLSDMSPYLSCGSLMGLFDSIFHQISLFDQLAPFRHFLNDVIAMCMSQMNEMCFSLPCWHKCGQDNRAVMPLYLTHTKIHSNWYISSVGVLMQTLGVQAGGHRSGRSQGEWRGMAPPPPLHSSCSVLCGCKESFDDHS